MWVPSRKSDPLRNSVGIFVARLAASLVPPARLCQELGRATVRAISAVVVAHRLRPHTCVVQPRDDVDPRVRALDQLAAQTGLPREDVEARFEAGFTVLFGGPAPRWIKLPRPS